MTRTRGGAEWIVTIREEKCIITTQNVPFFTLEVMSHSSHIEQIFAMVYPFVE